MNNSTESSDIIKEYLKANGLKSTLDNYEKEEKQRLSKNVHDNEKNTKMGKLILSDKDKSKEISSMQDNYKVLEKKHQSILQCGRQILSIAKTCLQHLQNIKDGNNTGENFSEAIENYKSYIGKYHKIILSDEWTDQIELMSQSSLLDIKSKLLKAKDEKKNETLIELLYSLRVHGLQIPSEQRKKFVNELIKNDIFYLTDSKEKGFIINLLTMHAYNIRHALLSNISILVSCYKGVEYIISNGFSILNKIIEIMKSQEDGSIIQRFCISIIYKISIKEQVLPIFINQGIIEWLLGIMQRSRYTEIPVFCLDYLSSLLVNILHSETTLKFLDDNVTICKNIFESFLSMIKETIPNTVLMNIIISLSFLSKDRFQVARNECKFYDRITEFVEFYSNAKTKDENSEIDKKNILDLCTYMFLHKDPNSDKNDDDKNPIIYEDVIKEFENEQGHLIFECFQDEIN